MMLKIVVTRVLAKYYQSTAVKTNALAALASKLKIKTL